MPPQTPDAVEAETRASALDSRNVEHESQPTPVSSLCQMCLHRASSSSAPMAFEHFDGWMQFGNAESVREKANLGCGICGYVINHPSLPDNIKPWDDFMVKIWVCESQEVPALVSLDIFFKNFREILRQDPVIPAIIIQAERTGNYIYSFDSMEVCERLQTLIRIYRIGRVDFQEPATPVGERVGEGSSWN